MIYPIDCVLDALIDTGELVEGLHLLEFQYMIQRKIIIPLSTASLHGAKQNN